MMLMNKDQAGRFERVLGRLPDGLMLRMLFTALLVATLAILALDFRQVWRSDHGQMPGLRQYDPVTMDRPSEQDHVRPYLPWTAPKTRDGGRLRMPGYDEPPGQRALSKSMTFRLGEYGRASAIGQIEPGTASEFERFLNTQDGKVRSIVLHSPGGSVPDALGMANLIRKNQLATVVPDNAYCASSCPLVFAGGSERAAGQGAWIGVHQVYTIASAIGTIHDGMTEAQKVSAVCQRHLVNHGVDPQVWIHAMSTPKHKLYVFTSEELRKYKLVTEASSKPSRPKQRS